MFKGAWENRSNVLNTLFSFTQGNETLHDNSANQERLMTSCHGGEAHCRLSARVLGELLWKYLQL